MIDALGTVANLVKPIAMQVLLARERLESGVRLQSRLRNRSRQTPTRSIAG